MQQWKIQPQRLNNKALSTSSIDKPIIWGHPLFSSKPNRAPNHRLFTTLNLFIASCFAMFVCELSVRGYNRMRFEGIHESDVYEEIDCVSSYMTQALHLWHTKDVNSALRYMKIFAVELSLLTLVQSVLEYFWHIMMHLEWCYARMHKLHHHYKSPEVWDDMYIHPIEAIGYYCILYGGPFCLSVHVSSFLAYMAIMGVCGVLDHSGIKFSIPYLYDTADHDIHHSKFSYNFAFPFPFMDLLMGTHYSQSQSQAQAGSGSILVNMTHKAASKS